MSTGGLGKHGLGQELAAQNIDPTKLDPEFGGQSWSGRRFGPPNFDPDFGPNRFSLTPPCSTPPFPLPNKFLNHSRPRRGDPPSGGGLRGGVLPSNEASPSPQEGSGPPQGESGHPQKGAEGAPLRGLRKNRSPEKRKHVKPLVYLFMGFRWEAKTCKHYRWENVNTQARKHAGT